MIYLEIDFNEFKKREGIIIDIREKEEYIKNHLPNSINISFYQLIVYPSKYLDKKKKYLLVCNYGIKSKKTSEILNRNGYHTFSLKKGYKGL